MSQMRSASNLSWRLITPSLGASLGIHTGLVVALVVALPFSGTGAPEPDVKLGEVICEVSRETCVDEVGAETAEPDSPFVAEHAEPPLPLSPLGRAPWRETTTDWRTPDIHPKLWLESREPLQRRKAVSDINDESASLVLAAARPAAPTQAIEPVPQPEVQPENPPPHGEGKAGVPPWVPARKDPRACAAPEYPAAARARGWKGRVLLEVSTDEFGTPLGVVLVESSGRQILDESALKTVRTWRFHPALSFGRAVPSRFHVPIRFGGP